MGGCAVNEPATLKGLFFGEGIQSFVLIPFVILEWTAA